MSPVYADHIDRATRAAALILTLPPPTGPELATTRRLHDDLAIALVEATRLVWLSGLGEPRPERERAGMPAAQEMLTALDDYPRVASGSATAGESPSQRWAGRPVDLTVDTTSLGAWKVLAAETFLARSCLDQMSFTTPVRAAVLDDLAAIADALAAATADLAVAGTSPAIDDRLLEASANLARAAARVQEATSWATQLDGPTTLPAAPAAREVRRVELVRQHTDAAPALANLARLTSTGQPHAAELFAITIMLGTVADAVASASNTAAQAPGQPQHRQLQDSAEALTDYRHELARLLRAHQPKLASIGPGNPAALAQARELRTAAVPALHALNGDPARAATAAADLRRIGAALAPATAAVRAAFSNLDQHAGLLAYDWAPGPGFHWRAATTVDTAPLIARMDVATQHVARLARRQPSPAAGKVLAVPASRYEPARIVDLTGAIDRRGAGAPLPGSTLTPEPLLSPASGTLARTPSPAAPRPMSR